MGFYQKGDVFSDIMGAVGSVAQYIPVVGTAVAAAAKGISGGLNLMSAAGGGNRTMGLMNMAANMVGGWQQSASGVPAATPTIADMQQNWSIQPQPEAMPYTNIGIPVRSRGGRRRRGRYSRAARPAEMDSLTTQMNPEVSVGYRGGANPNIWEPPRGVSGSFGYPDGINQVEVMPHPLTERQFYKF